MAAAARNRATTGRRTCEVLWPALAMCVLVSPLRAQDVVSPPATAAPTAAGTAVYSDSQATRGERWFASACAACHPGRALASPDFQLKWSGRTALDLFDRLRNSMPLDAPGSLSRRTYADIVAYLMRLNGLPAGTNALAPDSLVLRRAVLAFDSATTPGSADSVSPNLGQVQTSTSHNR